MPNTVDERRALQLARLEAALPEVFPAAVLTHARARRFAPPTPRLAADSYWRAHPVRADRLARMLAARSGAPPGWRWDPAFSGERRSGFRLPPAPFREKAHVKPPGWCCICGQPVFRFGWHADLWADGAVNRNAVWHGACVVAWRLWIAPRSFVPVLRRLQRGRCAESGRRLFRTAEVDHRLPLFRVWRDHRDLAWPELLGFWGVPNLRVVNRDVHVAKCASEAGERSLRRLAPPA